MSHEKSIRTTSMAASRIKEIKDNWDWHRSTGLLKGWSQFKYRKVGGTKCSEVLSNLEPSELLGKLTTMAVVDIEIRE